MEKLSLNCGNGYKTELISLCFMTFEAALVVSLTHSENTQKYVITAF